VLSQYVDTVDRRRGFEILKINNKTLIKTALSSLARTLGSWVRIPLKAWMYDVCLR
jgi:hypothetical protein